MDDLDAVDLRKLQTKDGPESVESDEMLRSLCRNDFE